MQEKKTTSTNSEETGEDSFTESALTHHFVPFLIL